MKRLLPGLLLWLAGCAQLPHDLPARPALERPEVAATIKALARASDQSDGQKAPSGQWWQTFGLADLNRLVETALKGAPDLDAAQARLRMADQAERLARLDAQVHYGTDASIVRQRLSENGIFPPPIGGSTFTQTDLTQSFAYSLDGGAQTARWCRPPARKRRWPGTESSGAVDALRCRGRCLFPMGRQSVMSWRWPAHIEQRHRKRIRLARSRFELGLDWHRQPVHDARQRLDLDADRFMAWTIWIGPSRYRLAACWASILITRRSWPCPARRTCACAADQPAPGLAWRRPDVAARRAGLEAARPSLTPARAEFYPNIDLARWPSVWKAWIWPSCSDPAACQLRVGPALHLPLFNTHTLQARTGHAGSGRFRRGWRVQPRSTGSGPPGRRPLCTQRQPGPARSGPAAGAGRNKTDPRRWRTSV